MAPAIVLAAGALLSALTLWVLRGQEAQQREREFLRRAQNIAYRSEDYLQRRNEALYALRDLLEFSNDINRAQFDGAASDMISRQVGIHALEWAPLVPSADRARVEAAARAEGYPQFQFTEHGATPNEVRPTGNRPIHAPVLYMVPYAGNEPALGFDLASDAVAWPKLLRYAEAGQLAASGRVPLLKGSQGGPSWGYITELPVYRKSLDQIPPSARLGELKGFVLGIFQLSDVFEEMFRRMGGLNVDALFLDRSAPPDRQFLHYHPAGGAANPSAAPPSAAQIAEGLHTVIPLDQAGRHWELWLRPSANWIDTPPVYRSWFFATLFLSLSALLSLFLLGQQRHTRLVEQQVTARTAELAESRRELDSFFHSLPGMAYRGAFADEKLHLTFVSEGSRALTGWTPEDFLIGRIHLRDLMHPDDLPRVRRATRTGLEQRLPIEVEYRLRTRDGREIWVLSRGRGVHGDGDPMLFEGLAIDISAQKQAERDRLSLERKMLEGQKLESLGLLAGGIAHDFNNLLTGVLGNASLARLSLPSGSPSDGQLRGIESAALRAAELCRQMLAYAGKGRFLVEPVDLTALIEGLLPLLQISIARQAELRVVFARDLPPVTGDTTQLRQIVMNLVINAAEAIGAVNPVRPGEIVLATGLMAVDAAMLATSAAGAELAPGNYVFLEVSDNGCGMTPEILAKIFDPFFTTKFTGRGLGLAAVLGIVRGHHGALRVTTQPGAGSRFQLLLPPAGTPAPTPVATIPVDGTWRHSGLALVIDDEEPVRAVAAEMLETLGMTALLASDGEAGIAEFRKHPTDFAVVLLDLMMPGLGGEESLPLLRSIRPEVPVLLMSGYNEGDLLSRLARKGSPLGFLPKPFTRETLIEKLRAVLT